MKKNLILALLFILSCKTGGKNETTQNPTEPEPQPLTKNLAEERSQKISDVRYHLKFDIASSTKVFTGTTTIEFGLKSSSGDVVFDFYNGKILSLTKAGATLPYKYDGSFIRIKGADLKVGTNQI